MKKKVLSLLLVLCMVVGMLPGLAIPAKAAGNPIYEYNGRTFILTISDTTCYNFSCGSEIVTSGSIDNIVERGGNVIVFYTISGSCSNCGWTGSNPELNRSVSIENNCNAINKTFQLQLVANGQAASDHVNVTITAPAQHLGLVDGTCTEAAHCTACNQTTGTIKPDNHAFSEEWKSDENMHWHECTREGCQYVSNYLYHSYTAGYVDNGNGTHSPKCECGAVDSTATEAHSFDDDSDFSCNACHYTVTPYTITLNANGGTGVSDTLTTNRLGMLTDLPKPTKTGYTFDGWFDAQTGGNRVDTTKVYTENTTLYAEWTECDHAGSTAQPGCESSATCTVCGGTVAATGHNWGTPTYTWSADNAACTAVRVCGNDSDHKETETVNSTASVTQEKSCTLPELTTYTATFTGAAFTRQTKEDVQTAPSTGHSYGSDWESDGTHHWHECACGDKQDAAEHTYDNACDTTCHVCGKVRTITHAYAEAYDDAEHWMECSVCHDKKDAAKHSFDNDLDSTCNGCSFTRTVTYAITAGNEQTVTKGNSATFTSNADFSKFLRVEVDGKTVDSSNYTAEEGSTKVTLKADYIKTLSVGEHTLTVVSNDGSASTTFKVKDPSNPDVPETGDETKLGLWLGMMMLAVCGIGAVWFMPTKKKGRYSR